MTTENPLRRMYRKNLEQLMGMRDKAKATGRKVSGFTLPQLEDRVAQYTAIYKMDDTTLVRFISANYKYIVDTRTALDATKFA